MTPEEAFGVTLRKFRKDAGLSQQALALEADLDRTYISLLERGLRQPSLRTIITLASILQVSPWRFVEDTMGLVG